MIHEFANPGLPTAQHLGKGAVIPGAGQGNHQRLVRLFQVGDREAAFHLACRGLFPDVVRRLGEAGREEQSVARYRDPDAEHQKGSDIFELG